jgi:hypothetical protein
MPRRDPQSELKLGEAVIFSFISHRTNPPRFKKLASHVKLFSNIRLAQNSFNQLMKLLEKLCQTGQVF